MPFFSVITITKNNQYGFTKTKQSIESQSFDDFEWVVIDGDVEPDNGIYDAMNKGMTRASGDYIVFMNAGDEFANEHTLKTVFDNHDGADLIYGDAIEGGHVKHARSHQLIAQGLFTYHQSIYYKRCVIGDLRYDETYPIAADYKFTAQFLFKDARAHYIPQPLCVFDVGGVSQLNAKQGRVEQSRIRRELGINAPFTPYRQYIGWTIKNYCEPLYWCIKKIDRTRFSVL